MHGGAWLTHGWWTTAPFLPLYLRIDELRVLLAAAQQHHGVSLTFRGYAIVALLACTGLRKGDSIGLRVDDVDLEEGLLRVRGKGGNWCVVPLAVSPQGLWYKSGSSQGALWAFHLPGLPSQSPSFSSAVAWATRDPIFSRFRRARPASQCPRRTLSGVTVPCSTATAPSEVSLPAAAEEVEVQRQGPRMRTENGSGRGRQRQAASSGWGTLVAVRR